MVKLSQETITVMINAGAGSTWYVIDLLYIPIEIMHEFAFLIIPRYGLHLCCKAFVDTTNEISRYAPMTAANHSNSP